MATEIKPEDYWRHMRAIMYQPTAVWISGSQRSSHRWLTDGFVMLDVTDSESFCDLPDGAYKLTVSKGPEPRDAEINLDLDAYFRSMDGRDWARAVPTMWSVIEEYNGKAMLWDAGGHPALMGEPTWAAIKRYYPDCDVEWSWRGNSVFRFSLDGEVFAYAAGIMMPEGQGARAEAIVDTAVELPEAA